MFTELLRERDSMPANAVWPQSINNTTATTGVVDMSLFHRVEFVGFIGAGTTGTVRAYLQESSNSNGVGATNIAGCIITNIVNTANQAFTLECSAMQLTKRYVVGVIEENQAIAKTVALFPIGTMARFKPANNSDVAAMAQRVVSSN